MKLRSYNFILVFVFFFVLCSSLGLVTFVGLLGNTAVAAESTSFERISKNLRQSVKDLDYPDSVADDLEQMIADWKNENNEQILFIWKQKIDDAKTALQNKLASEDHVAAIEADIAAQLMYRIRKEIHPNLKSYELDDILKNKRANCFGYSQLLYILGNSIGLSVTPIFIDRMFKEKFNGMDHMACLVRLSDGKMIDLDVTTKFASSPFVFNEQYKQNKYYWIIQDKNNPLRLPESLKIITENGIKSLVYANRGSANALNDRYREAFSDFDKSIELEPTFANTYYNRGITFGMIKQYTQAIAEYDKAIELNNCHYFAFCQRGYSYCRLENFNQALVDCNKAIELYPQHFRAYQVRGLAYSGLGDFDNAIGELTKSIELNPEWYSSYFDRGVIYSKFGHYPEAVADFTKSIELNPKHSESFFNRGIANANLGMLEKAKEDLLKSVEMKPALEEEAKKVSDKFNLNLESNEKIEE